MNSIDTGRRQALKPAAVLPWSSPRSVRVFAGIGVCGLEQGRV